MIYIQTPAKSEETLKVGTKWGQAVQRCPQSHQIAQNGKRNKANNYGLIRTFHIYTISLFSDFKSGGGR